VRRLARLAALTWVRAIAPGTWTPAAVTESLPDLLAPRILEDLQQNPLRLNAADHRRQLHVLVARFGGFTHYELLRLDPHAEPAEVHPAFLELVRVVHPSHAERLGLGAEASATLQMIFERACEAYNVLSDQQRRDRYDAEIGVSAATAPQAAEARMTERRELAKSYFAQASARARDEDYHFAIELLRQAVRADPRPEYWKLLASCLMRNPKWLPQALHAARQAARQRPSDIELRTLLGEIHELMGETEEASQQFREALELDPGNIAAEEGLARLAAVKEKRPAPVRLAKPSAAGAVRSTLPTKRPYRR
jgi:Flp pilus assembly protein TadD